MRRRVLMAMAVFALSLPRFATTASAQVFGRHPFLKSLRALFSSLASVRDIGERYLLSYPEHVRIDRLANIVGLDVEDLTSDLVSQEELRHGLGVRRKVDFGVGRVVVLDGVVLARSEAAVCALFVTLESGAGR